MKMDSLDPRISRWDISLNEDPKKDKSPLDQLVTYEVFIQMKDGRAFEHTGIVHACNLEMAFLFAKEQFSRRYTCTGMWVVATENVFLSPYTDLEENVYDQIPELSSKDDQQLEDFEIFHLTKRGKQHKHVGRVQACNYQQALSAAKSQYDGPTPILNVWVVRSADFLCTEEQDKVIWSTLHEKIHRDVTSYKAADKIKAFKEKMGNHG